MSAQHIIVPQGWRYGAPILSHYMRINKHDARLLFRSGVIEEVDVVRRLWRLRLAEICDQTKESGGSLALHIDSNVRGIMMREMAR